MTAATVLLVGCGKMGSALLAGWVAGGSLARCVIVEPQGGPPGPLPDGVSVVADAAAIPADLVPDAVIFAVKPQVMDGVVGAYRRFAGATFLSIAAGKPVALFQRLLGADAAVVRAMPNTPAAIGRGITGAFANPAVGAAGRALAQRLLSAVGEVAWVEREDLLDAVTAVSGSGPAYVFLLAEALAAAGARVGLPPALAQQLARATVAGAGELLHRLPDSADQLRRNVTSPGGTTQAALDVLMATPGLQGLMDEAVAAATRRSRELAG
jgi:pyrroline-5-carboxylate reductase